MLSEEKRLTDLEKEADLESRKEILAILREIQAEKRKLEERRLGKYYCRTIPHTYSWHVSKPWKLILREDETVERIQKWLNTPGCAGIRDLNSRLREPNTGEWILDHAKYKSWIQPIKNETKSQQTRRFERNML